MVAPKFYQKLTSNVEKGNNQWYSFFWAASIMASVCIIAVLLCEILAVAVTDTPTVIRLYMYNIRIMVIIKLTMVGLLIPLDILVACYIFKSEKEGFPVPMLVYILSFPLCCTCSCVEQIRSKWIQSLALSSLLLFIQLVALSALPTIMWGFVFPVQGLAVITFFAAAIFCMTALIALLIRNIGQVKCSGTCRDNQNLMQLLLLPVAILFLAVVILTIYIYITYITSGVTTNQVGGLLVSLLPSAILTIIGWFVTKGKFLKQLFPQENDSTRSKPQDNPSTERTPLNAL